MIEVEIKCFQSGGKYLGTQTIGYFRSADEAKDLLKEFVPWHFNTAYGSPVKSDFILKDKPGKLDDNQELLEMSRSNLKHALMIYARWPLKETN